METPVRPFPIQPRLPASAKTLEHRFLCLVEEVSGQPAEVLRLVDVLLADPELQALSKEDRLSVKLFFDIIGDLVSQGWRFDCREGQLTAIPPEAIHARGTDHREVKNTLRASLVAARNEQLREPSTRRFLREMERPRWHHGRYVSVLSLFASPADLADDIERRLDSPSAIRDELLLDLVSPYLQHATEERDEHTGLRLIDIWRYCRYTWSLPLSPQPGRQMMYLVRDASRRYHPIMGIGALGSSVVQITCRDEDIGWSLSTIERDARKAARVHALAAALDQALNEILWDDLLSPEEIIRPSSTTLDRLMAIADDSGALNRTAQRNRTLTLEQDARAPLYRRKRALELRRLLHARRVFQMAEDVTTDQMEMIEWLLQREDGRQALTTAIRTVKKRHIGSSMMDITTCGAIPPYSDVLAGKLTALLMASPQVVADYAHRYDNAQSEIASRMKGGTVIRDASLVLLGTSSLYHVGSSQYNRLRAPVAHGELLYRYVGRTLGYGSVHLSRKTYATLKRLLREHPDLAPESNAFAAGVNYKMRSIAAGLSHLGLGRLQQHKTPRLVYVVPLARNWREYLTGLEDEPRWLYERLDAPEVETNALAVYWKHRWLLPRLQRVETVQALRTRDLPVPVSKIIRGRVPPIQSSMFEIDERTPQRPATNTGGAMDTAAQVSWKTLAEFRDQRASFAEKLADEELRNVHIISLLDQGALDAVRQGRRLYLTGNPGDGKTHLIRRHAAELGALGAFVHLDASAIDEQSLADQLALAVEQRRPAIIAINEGPLRRLLPKLPGSERQQLQTQLDLPYLYEASDDREYDALLVNLGLRQVLSPSFVDGILDVVLKRVDYSDAPEIVRANVAMLAHQRVQSRLRLLLDLVARSGAHVTMHELLGFFAHIVTGGSRGVARSTHHGYYCDLVFEAHSPLTKWLRPFDPATIAHPIVDMSLWDGDFQGNDGGMEWLAPVRDAIPSQEDNPQKALAKFHALKRRYLFEARDGDQLFEMLPDDRAAFFKLLNDSDTSRDRARARALKALALFFGDEAQSEGRLQIWTSLRYEGIAPPSAFVSSQAVTSEQARLCLPRLRPQVARLLEYRPSHVRLVVKARSGENEAVGLNLDLELWMALMRIQRGLPQRHHDPVIGRRLYRFMSRLAAEYGATRTDSAHLLVQDIEMQKTYHINVSVGNRRYFR